MSHTVLYIEDNADNIQLVRRMISRRGETELLVAMNGSDGIQAAVDEQPSLILLDNRLPDATGSQVLRQLGAAEHTAAIPVVMVTGDSSSSTASELLALGAADSLAKPFDIRQFMTMLDRYLCWPARRVPGRSPGCRAVAGYLGRRRIPGPPRPAVVLTRIAAGRWPPCRSPPVRKTAYRRAHGGGITMQAAAMVLRARLRQFWKSWLALSLLVAVVGGLVLAAASGGRRTAAAFPGFVARHGYDAVVYGAPPQSRLARLPRGRT